MVPPRFFASVPYRLVESSSDIVVESEAADLGGALVYLAQGFSHVVTAGSKVEPKKTVLVKVKAAGSLSDLAVSFANELVYLFDTQRFLPADGALDVTTGPDGHVATGRLQGEGFEQGRHAFGTEVKAATLHDALLVKDERSARARVLLDL